MKILARFFSNAFSPILVASYGVLTALICSTLDILVPLNVKMLITGVTFFITGCIPVIGIALLFLTKRISDPALNNRSERTIPYILTGLCYLGCALYLYRINAPSWLWTFPIGGALAVIVSILVNSRWKISAHLAGMGGVTAIFFRIALDGIAKPGIEWWVMASLFITGCLASSRIILGRHTLGQTLAGAANGFFWVLLVSAF